MATDRRGLGGGIPCSGGSPRLIFAEGPRSPLSLGQVAVRPRRGRLCREQVALLEHPDRHWVKAAASKSFGQTPCRAESNCWFK